MMKERNNENENIVMKKIIRIGQKDDMREKQDDLGFRDFIAFLIITIIKDWEEEEEMDEAYTEVYV